MTRVGVIAWVLIVVCRLATTAHAYRTNENLPGLEGKGPATWPSRVVRFEVADDAIPGFSADRARRAIRGGMMAWQGHDCAELILNLVSANRPPLSGDGVNTIAWLRGGLDGLGLADGAVGFADVIYGTTSGGDAFIVEADIYFDASSVLWTDSEHDAAETGRLRVQTAVAHELGHALGFMHPCEVGGEDDAPDCSDHAALSSDLLFPLYNATAALAPSPEEIQGLCDLYPIQSCSSVCAEDEVCLGGQCHSTCGHNTCGEKEACIGGTCAEIICDDRDSLNLPCIPCAHDADCGAARACAKGICIQDLRGLLGDPCTDAAHCRKGACIESYCSDRCVVDDDCSRHYRCLDRVCVAERGVFGATCSYASQCTSEKCLYNDEAASGTCTRSCSDAAICPPAHQCRSLEYGGQQICVPHQLGGCDALPTHPGLFPLLTLWIFALIRRHIVHG